MTKKRILIITDSMRAGGKERRISELLKIMAQSPDYEFMLLVLNGGIFYEEIIKLPIITHCNIRKFRYDAFSFYRLFRITRGWRPDIVHCWDSLSILYGLFLKTLSRVFLVNSMVIDSKVAKKYTKHWRRNLIGFKFSDLITTNSQAGFLSYKPPAKKTRIIYTGVNIHRFNGSSGNGSNAGQGAVRITMIASNNEHKDYCTFIEAALSLLRLHNNLQFYCVGEDVPLLTARIPKASLNHFYLLPQTHEIEKIIKESDIGVLSSVSEGFPNVVLEFMACGKPVVVSRVGGVPEMIDESMDGFLVAPKNSRELHTTLDRLVKDESLRLRVGEKAKEKIQQKFPIENMIAGFQEAYSISENPTILS